MRDDEKGQENPLEQSQWEAELHEEQEADAPGWEAIDAALNKQYAGMEPFHYGTMISYRLGGPDPLDGVSVYKREEPIPHWHYVTYGFTELYEKESENEAYSGFGFELTFRLAAEGEDQPPVWAINFLQNLARYVFSSGNGFQPGHHLDANGPIEMDRDTLITAVAFTEDPELGEGESTLGKFRFVQVVGITADELDLIKIWNTTSFLQLAKNRLPLGVTDLNRASLLDDSEIRQAADLGVRTEGSSTGVLYFESLVWHRHHHFGKSDSYTLELGAKQAEVLGRMLSARLVHDRQLTLIGPDTRVELIPDVQNRTAQIDDGLQLYLNADAVSELTHKLKPQETEFTLAVLPTLSVRIVKTYLRDSEGNIVETIG